MLVLGFFYVSRYMSPRAPLEHSLSRGQNYSKRAPSNSVIPGRFRGKLVSRAWLPMVVDVVGRQ